VPASNARIYTRWGFVVGMLAESLVVTGSSRMR
jgi:hypothetical protein